VVYHYDRIFIALLVSIGILYAVYHFIFGEHNNIDIPEPQHQVEQPLSESPDPIASTQNNATPEFLNIPEFSHQKNSAQPSDLQQSADNREILQQKSGPFTKTDTSESQADEKKTAEPGTSSELPEITEAEIIEAVETE